MDVDRLELVKAQLQPFLRQGEEYVRRVEEFAREIPPIQIYIAVGAVFITTFLIYLSNFTTLSFHHIVFVASNFPVCGYAYSKIRTPVEYFA